MAEETALDALLAPAHVRVQMPVQWGAMDAFQHVNNVVYFQYFEDARIAYFAKVGMIGDEAGGAGTMPTGVGPILASTQCRFKRPLSFPDTVHIAARVVQIGSDRFEMAYTVVSERHEAVAALGSGWIVSYDYQDNKKAPLPEAWRASIEALDGPVPRWTPPAKTSR